MAPRVLEPSGRSFRETQGAFKEGRLLYVYACQESARMFIVADWVVSGPDASDPDFRLLYC